ncbi:YqgE/AlgH family protein [Piscinibacterium candidicorallinum]|uniref:UPF0301 protein ACFOEN_14870 n=1 Tax=Piscinibacterium candidicorallinum TaxID=1793872 RepID=A0ABV7H5G1_9BURK
MDLTDHFLISMPAMQDPNFSGAVIYMCEHTEKGALGLVINRPSTLTIGGLFSKVDLDLQIEVLRDEVVFVGGPVQNERGFVLHQPQFAFNSSLKVGGERALTTSRDVLESIGRGDGPHQMLISLGYSGWSGGQLEKELAENAWLTVKADPRVIFDIPVEERYSAAIGLLGISPAQLASIAGHA